MNRRRRRQRRVELDRGARDNRLENERLDREENIPRHRSNSGNDSGISSFTQGMWNGPADPTNPWPFPNWRPDFRSRSSSSGSFPTISSRSAALSATSRARASSLGTLRQGFQRLSIFSTPYVKLHAFLSRS